MRIWWITIGIVLVLHYKTVTVFQNSYNSKIDPDLCPSAICRVRKRDRATLFIFSPYNAYFNLGISTFNVGISNFNVGISNCNPSNDTGKIQVPYHSRCGTIKIPPCSKALSAEHRPKFLTLQWQWWRLHISEKFLSGTWNRKYQSINPRLKLNFPTLMLKFPTLILALPTSMFNDVLW
jgi:hypothetical protein